jgi:hypothetical protein
MLAGFLAGRPVLLLHLGLQILERREDEQLTLACAVLNVQRGPCGPPPRLRLDGVQVRAESGYRGARQCRMRGGHGNDDALARDQLGVVSGMDVGFQHGASVL